MKYFVFIICLSSLLFAQNPNGKYVTVPFKDGLPEGSGFKWKNTLYSSVNVGDFFKSISVVSRDSLKTVEGFYLYVLHKDGSLDLQPYPVTKDSVNTYSAKILLTTTEEDKLSPLLLTVNPADKTLSYRWENKDKNQYDKPEIIEPYALKLGAAFPQIEVETENGVWTNKNTNKITVINYWATTCVPCVAEIPGLNKLVKKYPKDKVEFISICDDKKNLPAFLSKNKFDYQLGYSSSFLETLLGEAFPKNIIIDKNGIIIYNKTSGSKDTYLLLEKILDDLLNNTPSKPF